MTQRRQFILGACATLLPLPLLAQTTVPQTNVIDALAGAGKYDNFIELARQAGAVETLRGAGPFTVLAPDNAAMQRMPNSLREDIAPSTGGSGAQRQDGDRVRLVAFVNMHIVEGRYTHADLADRVTTLRTRNGNAIEIDGRAKPNMTVKIVGNSGFGVGGVTIATAPTLVDGSQIICSNGVVLPVSEPVIQ